MKKVAKIFLLIAIAGASATAGHMLYELARMDGCMIALQIDNAIPDSLWEKIKPAAKNWCERALDN